MLEKLKNKKTNTLLCLLMIVFSFFILNIWLNSYSKRKIDNQKYEEALEKIEDKIDSYSKSTESEIEDWEYAYEDTTRKLFEDYTTSAEEMKQILEENEYDFEKWDCIELLKVLKNAEAEGYLIRYDLDEIESRAYSFASTIIQIDASSQLNQITEIQSIKYYFKYIEYSYDEYKPKFEHTDCFDKMYEFSEENNKTLKNLSTYKSLYQDSTIDINPVMVEDGHAVIEGTRYVSDTGETVSFKAHFDCNNPTNSCLFVFDEDYETAKEEITNYANRYTDKWEWKRAD